jgi:hypothetical protein
MSNNDVPPELLIMCEQAYAEANERLNAILEDIERTIRLREKMLGIRDDSVHYVWLRDFIIGQIAKNGPQVTAIILSAALFRLARAPRVADPLEYLESTMKDKGSEQK